MKKYLLMALAAIFATGAQAQDSAVKEALKTEKYSDAKKILKPALTADETLDKPAAYNAGVTLAMRELAAKGKKYQTARAGISDPKFNITKYYDAAYDAVKNTLDGVKYDTLPNAKGKVAPKYMKKNANRVTEAISTELSSSARDLLIDAGVDAFQKDKDWKRAQKFLACYIDCAYNEAFAGKNLEKLPNFSTYAYYTAFAAYQSEQYKKVKKYAEYGLENTTDSATIADLIEIELAGGMKTMETADDSIKVAKQFKKLYKQYPDNSQIFSTLMTIYEQMGDTEGAQKLLSERLKSNPTDHMAWALKGQNAQQANDYEAAVKAYKKCLELKPDFIQVAVNAGVCLTNLANEFKEQNCDTMGNLSAENQAKVDKWLKQAQKYLEGVKEQDPNCEQVNWKYHLARVYYAQGKTAEAEALQQ